jgi:hypothetical protein
MHAKQWFLTYPKCYLEKDVALSELQGKFAATVDAYVVAREMHQDGTPHLHMYLKFNRKINLNKNMNKFDLTNPDDPEKPYHGHYLTCRNPAAVLKYCTKGGDFIKKDVGKDDNIAKARDMAKDGMLQEAKAVLWETDPRLMLRSYTQVCAALTSLTYQRYQTPYSLEDFKIPEALAKWWETDSIKNSRSLILCGEAGWGKTAWARCLHQDHLFCCQLDDLKALNKQHKMIIFDDMSFGHIPRGAQLHLTDLEHERSIRIRYVQAHIPARTWKIFLTNEPCIFGETMGDAALERRVYRVNLTESLIKPR